MIKTNRLQSGQSGFSLIELMVVVAIIGVLSTIAMPNYQQMVFKAHQSEAKGMLSSIFAAESTALAEGGVYTYCLYQSGYIPEGARINYTSGFWGYSGCTACLNIADSNNLCNVGAAIPWGSSVRNDATFQANFYANALAQSTSPPQLFQVTPNQFLAIAFGSLTTLPLYDIWTMDQNRVLTNEQPGF